MIGFWLVAAVLTAAVVVIVLRPLMGGAAQAESTEEVARRVYADQLADIDRDLARGVLTADQAKAARAEVGRRLLATDAALSRQGADPGRPVVPAKRLSLALVVLIPAGTLSLYLAAGRPDLPAVPFAERGPAEARGGVPHDVEVAAANLAKALEQNPDNLEGWKLLAATYGAMGRHGLAVEAYRRAVALSKGDPDVTGDMGEQMVMAAQGVVGDEAQRTFEAVLSVQPDDPRARFYLALARRQAGDLAGAVDRWLALLRQSPADAPWVEAVTSQVAEAVKAGNLPAPRIETLPPSVAEAAPQGSAAPAGPAGAPETDTGRAIAALPPAEQQAAIRGMVEKLAARLEAEPGDTEGWVRLGRARQVLGDREPAIAAFRRALENDPAQAEATYRLGLLLAESGRAEEARALWTRLLPRLPEGSPERAELSRRIEQLTGG